MMVFRKSYQIRKGIQYIHHFPSVNGEDNSAVAKQSPGVNRPEFLRDRNKQLFEFAAPLPLLSPVSSAFQSHLSSTWSEPCSTGPSKQENVICDRKDAFKKPLLAVIALHSPSVPVSWAGPKVFGFSPSAEVFGQVSRCIKVLSCTFFSNCSKGRGHQAEIHSVNSAACGQLFLPTMHYEGLIVKVVHLLAPLVAGANRRKKKPNKKK